MEIREVTLTRIPTVLPTFYHIHVIAQENGATVTDYYTRLLTLNECDAFIESWRLAAKVYQQGRLVVNFRQRVDSDG